MKKTEQGTETGNLRRENLRKQKLKKMRTENLKGKK